MRWTRVEGDERKSESSAKRPRYCPRIKANVFYEPKNPGEISAIMKIDIYSYSNILERSLYSSTTISPLLFLLFGRLSLFSSGSQSPLASDGTKIKTS